MKQQTGMIESMESPKVSVVIPAHNQAAYLGGAIDSVLQQSYANLELIVVNDASPDHTNAVVARYDDTRLKLILHEENQGLPAARNSGMRIASGELIALLDADDLFHQDKLQAHVTYLRDHPEIGVSYNARYEFCENDDILALWRPPTTATFADVVLGFPFSPSDMVLRREWALAVDFFDESYKAMSEDLDINVRLALAGCRFGGVDQPLNYRRYYPNRVIRNVPDRLEGAERALNTLFDNPACPPEIMALKADAFANHYLAWAYEAFVAELTELGQRTLQDAIALKPELTAEHGAELFEFLIDRSVQDGGDHRAAIRCVVDQLPADLRPLAQHVAQAVAEADLRAGIREVIWGRRSEGELLLQRAALTEGTIDEALLRLLVDQLINYRQMIGDDATELLLRRLRTSLRLVADKDALQWMEGCYWLNRGFYHAQHREARQARHDILRAFWKHGDNLRNRGAWATLVRTLLPLQWETN